jgi:hypothetical protein
LAEVQIPFALKHLGHERLPRAHWFLPTPKGEALIQVIPLAITRLGTPSDAVVTARDELVVMTHTHPLE